MSGTFGIDRGRQGQPFPSLHGWIHGVSRSKVSGSARPTMMPVF